MQGMADNKNTKIKKKVTTEPTPNNNNTTNDDPLNLNIYIVATKSNNMLGKQIHDVNEETVSPMIKDNIRAENNAGNMSGVGGGSDG